MFSIPFPVLDLDDDPEIEEISKEVGLRRIRLEVEIAIHLTLETRVEE